METMLWCWDSRMTWDDEADVFASPVAVSNQAFPYPKRPESYTCGFRRLIDYCSRHGIHGIIIWGFLRDAHGGVAAAQELCRYAADHGVAIYPGVGLCSYGGYYFEGDHPFHLQTYLRTFADRRTSSFDAGLGKQLDCILDPSLPANQQWWLEGLEWMLETFDIGGINFEMGDHLVHQSESAVTARQALRLTCQESLQDMVIATRDLMDAAYRLCPNKRFINSTYMAPSEVSSFPNIMFPRHVHPLACWMYTMSNVVITDNFSEIPACSLPHRKGAYLHWGRAGSKEMNNDTREALQRVIPILAEQDFEFTCIYGETSPEVAPMADGNYREFVRLAHEASRIKNTL